MKKKVKTYTQEEVDKIVETRLEAREAARKSEAIFMEQFKAPAPPKFVVAFGGSLPSFFYGTSVRHKEGRFFYEAKDAAAFALANHGIVYALGAELTADASLTM